MLSNVLEVPLTAVHGFARWLGGRALPRLPYPVVRGPLRGARFILGAAAGEGGGSSVYINRVEPGGTKALLSVLKPAQIVFDIGANVGYYTLLASRQVGPSGRVVAFEPSVRNISYLYRHLDLNRANNVTALPLACSDRNGLALFIEGANCATGRIGESAEYPPHAKSNYVPTTTLDEFVRESGLLPDVLKIDVEGAEEKVLRGAARTLASRPIVLLSVHSESLKAACTSYLLEQGYAEPTAWNEPWDDAELLFVAASRDVTSRNAVKNS